MDGLEFTKEWIKDLRSGKFKQGQGLLCRVDGFGISHYCCLGVAVETLKRVKPEYGYDFRRNQSMTGVGVMEVDGSETYLGDPVAKAMGFPAWEPTDEFQAFMSMLNDDHGLTFDEIADVLQTMVDNGSLVPTWEMRYEYCTN